MISSFTEADLDQTIPARFEAVATAYASRLALTGNGRRWTYDALNRHANQIAHAIRGRIGSGAGSVAYVVDQSPEMIVAALAVLKAGATCLAIHPGLPRVAQAAIVKDFSPNLILTRESLAASTREVATGLCDVLMMDELDSGGRSDNPASSARPNDPAIVLYTSGTTGEPKGVVWSHRRMLHRVWLSTMYEAITPADRQSLMTHCSFANAQGDVFGALLEGAALCVFDVVSEGFTAFHEWLDEEQITLVRSPATLFRQFLANLDEHRRFPGIRTVTVGGEVAPADVERWKHHFPRPCKLLLRFSATEIAMVTVARIDHDTVCDSPAALAGPPVADKELVVVDEQGLAVAAGEEGELIVSSAFLADGYWRRPDDTARAFTPDPRSPDRQSYRTGDRGYLTPDGRFVFRGRRDHQVKIRGHRVEIREVETALRNLDDVSEAVVVVLKDEEQQRLFAFVVARAGRTCAPAALRSQLLARLPEWKIPARFHVVESLPTTLSGKVDRRRLLEQAVRGQAESASALVPGDAERPRDELEGAIADRWKVVLRCGSIGRTDDFFVVGGDSLQATVLHLEIENLTGFRIPLEALFENPTVSAMARVVRSVRESEPARRSDLPAVLVPFRKTGALAPLFLVHGRLGRAVVRPEFLEILGSDQPVYGLQAGGLDRGRMKGNTIAEMAREYVTAIRQVQPSGPYFLGGPCAGGVVAIEMANQLRAAGEDVAPLLLFDPPANPVGDRPFWSRSYLTIWAHLRKRFAGHWWNPTAGLLRRRDSMRGGQLRDRSSLEQAVRVAMDFSLAGLTHRGWRYDGEVLLLRSQVRLRLDDPQRGRRGTFTGHLTGEVRRFEAGATHPEVVGGRSELAVRQIRHCVDIARAALETMSRERKAAHEARAVQSLP